MPTTRRRYSAKERAKAVGIAAVEGVTAAERSTGIPKETIHYWANKPEFAQLRTTARETVVTELWVGIQVGVKELVSGLQGDAPLNHKADAFKSLADRYALLNGEATERIESITDDLPPDVKRALRERLARSVRGESVAQGTGDDAGRAGPGLAGAGQAEPTSAGG
jgi:hypothetical protein